MAQTTTLQQDRIIAERLAYTGEPSERLQKAAKLINSGKGVEEAMREAGYGKRYIAGSAKTFPGVLASAGLLDEKKAAKLTPAVKPEIPAATTERETIR